MHFNCKKKKLFNKIEAAGAVHHEEERRSELVRELKGSMSNKNFTLTKGMKKEKRNIVGSIKGTVVGDIVY